LLICENEDEADPYQRSCSPKSEHAATWIHLIIRYADERLTRLHQPQQRRHVINRTLDDQRFYWAAIFASISVKYPIIAIGMRLDLRKPDACAAYWTRILGSYAKRYILRMHELPLHSLCVTNNRAKSLS
jgi:hypothetical protein